MGFSDLRDDPDRRGALRSKFEALSSVMVRFLKRGHSLEKSSRRGAKEMFENGGVGGNGSAAAASTGGASETTVRPRHGGAAANGGREGPPSGETHCSIHIML